MHCHHRHFIFSLIAALLLTAPGFAQEESEEETAAALEPGEHFVEVNGARIFYQVSGDEGMPLVLIHGYPLSSGLFREQHEELSDAFRVITPDLRGFGQSKFPDSGDDAGDADASIEIYADDMLALLEEMGVEKAIIGGHSMGGMTVLKMYEQDPDRFRAMVLISTTAAPAPIVGQHLWTGYAEQAKKEGVGSLVPVLIDEMLTGPTRMKNQDLVKHMEGLIHRASEEGAIAGGKALAERPDQTDLLGSIEVPTLVMVGVEDTVTPVPLSRKMAESIPDAELFIMEEASHAAIIEQADRANAALLRWVAEKVAGAEE